MIPLPSSVIWAKVTLLGASTDVPVARINIIIIHLTLTNENYDYNDIRLNG